MQRLLHVSYDPTREFFEAYNKVFADQLLQEQGTKVTISQSHGGSGKQARALIEGLKADVVSLALGFDIDQIAARQVLSRNWRDTFPQGPSPFYSTIAFLVREGNPKNIKDWQDLIQPGIEVITPNPKTSGGARWNYLAALAYAKKYHGTSEAAELTFLRELFSKVPVFDSGSRGAATTFVEREIGDVLLVWESDAFLILKSDRGSNFELVYPSISVRAEPVVSIVDSVVDARGSRDLAYRYLSGLYENQAQELLIDYHFRSIIPEIMRLNRDTFPAIEMISISEFGGWDEVQKTHFSDRGIFDQVTNE